MQNSPPKANSDSDMVRARIDPLTKEQWDEWCTRVNITPSQGLRWLISMHLADPGKLWAYLALQDKQDAEKGTQCL